MCYNLGENANKRGAGNTYACSNHSKGVLTMADSIIPKSPGIYRIICLATNKVYIGSAGNLAKRWRDHLRKLRLNRHQNEYLQRAWNKYGEAAFRFEVLELVMPWSLLDREQYWLDKLKPYNPVVGFNIAHHANTPVHTPEVIAKLRAASTGKSPSNQTRAKLSAANKGKSLSSEHRAKISASSKGKVRSTETRAKMSLAKRGQSQSANNIAKRVEGIRKSYVAISPDGMDVLVNNLKQFCRDNGLNYSGMLNVANGYDRSHRGWKCRHVEGER